MYKARFKMGDDVAHIDNCNFKIRVRRVVYKDKKLSHIVCDWWENEEKKEDNFHSKELIPWKIASKGKEVVDEYIANLEFEKTYPEYTK